MSNSSIFGEQAMSVETWLQDAEGHRVFGLGAHARCLIRLPKSVQSQPPRRGLAGYYLDKKYGASTMIIQRLSYSKCSAPASGNSIWIASENRFHFEQRTGTFLSNWNWPLKQLLAHSALDEQPARPRWSCRHPHPPQRRQTDTASVLAEAIHDLANLLPATDKVRQKGGKLGEAVEGRLGQIRWCD